MERLIVGVQDLNNDFRPVVSARPFSWHNVKEMPAAAGGALPTSG